MAELNILNPTAAWNREIEDSLGPDFGWERLRKSQLATDKPAFGAPYTLTVGDGGHSTTFSWLNRSRKCAEYLKRWAEEFEDGFFTVIDHDGSGRHYVGRFVGDMPVAEAGNDRYNLQGWTFEELPGVPMLEYPSDWEHWAVNQYPVDDYGGMKAATFAAGTSWQQPAAAADSHGHVVRPKQLQTNAPLAGDWIAQQYRGYGFRLWLDNSPGRGVGTLFVDGVQIATLNCATSAALGPHITYHNARLPLGAHTVRLVMATTDGTVGGPVGSMLWDKLEVMR